MHCDSNVPMERARMKPQPRSARQAVDVGALIDSAQEASSFLKALAHETRLLTLCMLTEGEKTVTEIEQILGLRQPAISQQLARLRVDGLVEARREGKNIYYSLARPEVREIVGALHRAFCQRPQLGSRAISPRPTARAAARAKSAGRRIHAPAKRPR